jgi:hypothetical protein
MGTYRRRLPASASTIPTRLLLGGAAGLTALAALLILDDREGLAGVVAALAGTAAIAGGRIATWVDDSLSRLFDPLLDRVIDGVLLGAIAWTARSARPAVAVAALAALGAGFLSSYVRARGASLGYDVQESTVTRGIRYALVAAGLAFGWLGWTIWTTAAISRAAAAIRTVQVTKEELA